MRLIREHISAGPRTGPRTGPNFQFLNNEIFDTERYLAEAPHLLNCQNFTFLFI